MVKLTVTDTCGINTKYAANHITVTGGPCNVGIDDERPVAQLSVTPNPTTGEVAIDNNANINGIEVTNIIGNKMPFRVINNSNRRHWSVDISNLPPGIYFISIETGKQSLKRKLVKL